MAQDVTKHLDRARRHLERQKVRDAIQDYEAALEISPANVEALQALGDLYARQNESSRATHYYGLLFDRLVEINDAAKAAALYARLLKAAGQPPERVARYALLLQRQHKIEEAIEQFQSAADLFLAQHGPAEALGCWERIAQLDPDNPPRYVRVGEIAELAGKGDTAARAYLRAGQLELAGGEVERAHALFSRAHQLAPAERGIALVYAEARLRSGDAAGAAALLEPFPAERADPPFLGVLGEALLRTGQLDRAQEPLEGFYRGKDDGFPLLFELAGMYLQADQEEKALRILSQLKARMFTTNHQTALAAALDQLAAANPKSLALAEFASQIYSELNREMQYFGTLVRLFDLYLEAGKLEPACDALDRLIDIDAYDAGNLERAEKLSGRVDQAYLKRIRTRLAKSTTTERPTSVAARGGEPANLPPASPEAREQQTLEDLIVQAEIFLQYSLREKVTDRLQKIAELFPGEEERNERLRLLQEAAGWETGSPKRAVEPAAGPPGAGRAGSYSAETLRDLARISDITRIVYRQATPREVLSAAVQEIGKYLSATRCLGAIGPAGGRPQMATEFCAPGVTAASGAALGRLLQQLADTPASSLGGLPAVELHASASPILSELGLESVLAVPQLDKDTQVQAGILIVGDATPRSWKPNECYFLQAVGDQMLLCVNHTKLRSLVRTLAVADEKTGLLGRSSYFDCLLAEMGRARTQSTPLSLLILQVDHGAEILRQQGESLFERFMEQLAKVVESVVRQNDLAVKYTAWALALVLPDTGLESARAIAEKLRNVAAALRMPGHGAALTLSAAVAEAVGRPDFETEDIVTDLVNRVEFSLEEARKQGGGTLVLSETPQL